MPILFVKNDLIILTYIYFNNLNLVQQIWHLGFWFFVFQTLKYFAHWKKPLRIERNL